METRFHYDLEQKHLCFKLRQGVTTDPGVELKGKGLFNTVEGRLNYRASLKKYVSTGPNFKDLGASPIRLGAGVAVLSGLTSYQGKESKGKLESKEPRDAFKDATTVLTLSAKKKLQLLEGPNTLVSVKGLVDYDPFNKRLATRLGRVKVSHKVFGLTKNQDVKVSAGVELHWPNGRDPEPALYLQVRENNWAFNYKNKRAFLTYDL